MANPQLEEIRIALVMNGGVSLAVWMGGVTNELFRLVTQSHPVYRGILELTKSTAKVDVISGTSAGGVNGAALATALLYGGRFDTLREVWMETGALEDLLCSPFGANPGSLLRGEDFFLPHIRSAFDGLIGCKMPLERPYTDTIDVQLTTTLLTGRRVRTIDTLGTQVGDVDYRGHFRFQRNASRDDFANQEQVLDALSRAARSSASFPFAFEPSTVDGGEKARLFDALGNPLTMKRHVIDGGILNNKPIGGALSAIFKCPRERGVRRVLAYINPDPGDGPEPKTMDQPPGLSTVLASSLLGIPQSQSIADQLQEIQRHNRDVQLRRDNVLNLVRAKTDHLALAGSLFDIYRQRRIVNTCQLFILDVLPMVTSAEPGASTRTLDDVCGKTVEGKPDRDAPPPVNRVPELEDALAVLGKQSRAAIRLTFEKIKWDTWIPTTWPEPDSPQNHCSEQWEWGLFPVEFFARVMLDFLRMTQGMSDIAVAFDELAANKQQSGNVPSAASTATPPAEAASKPSSSNTSPAESKPVFDRKANQPDDPELASDWHDYDDHEFACFARVADSPTPLARLWRRAYRVLRAIEKQREVEDVQWEARAIDFLCGIKRQLDEQRAVAGGTAAVQFTYVAHPDTFTSMFAFLGAKARRRACARLAHLIARIVRLTCNEASAVIDDFARHGAPPLSDPPKHLFDPATHTKREELNDLMVQRLCDLEALTAFLSDGQGDVQPHVNSRYFGERTALYRLLQLEVIQYAFNDRDELTDDTLIELVQISGNSAGPLMTPGSYTTARDKLLGLQVAHFAAFYKQSWRVNDWTYGRLDGSERLVKLLLNPERLQLAFMDPVDAAGEIRRIALDDLTPGPLKSHLDSLWICRNYFERLCAELSFLTNNCLPLPDMLPLCAEVLTLRLHLGILRDELPYLVTAIEGDRGNGADADARSRKLLRLLGDSQSPVRFTPREAEQACRDGLIAGAKLIDETGSDLFTRTLAHIVAATQRTLASEAAKLGPIRALSASVRVPIVGFYLTARGLTHQSRTSAALNGGLLVLGLALLCIQFFWVQFAPEIATAHVSGPQGVNAPSPMPHTLVTIAWLLFAYGFVISILRWRALLIVLYCVAVLAAFAVQFHAGQAEAAGQSFEVAHRGIWILIFLLAVLLLVSLWVFPLQWVAGLAVIVAAGIASTGKADCAGETLLYWVHPGGVSPACTLPSILEAPVLLSIVVAVALLLAMLQQSAEMRVQAWHLMRRPRRSRRT